MFRLATEEERFEEPLKILSKCQKEKITKITKITKIIIGKEGKNFEEIIILQR